MQDIIDKIAAQVGIDPDLAQKATSMIVNFIATQAPAEYVDMIKQYVPGFDDVAAAGASHAESSEAESGGGGLMGALGGLMGGGGMASAMAMLGTLQKDGLDMSQIKDVAGSLIGQMREVAGDETVEKLLAQIPGANHLLG